MATEVKMPQMGESIAEGTLTRWFKKPGDTVVRDEPLFEISTDKVDAEVPAPSDGILEQVLVAEGTTVEVNTVVALLGDGSGTAQAPADTTVSSTPAANPIEVAAADPVEVPVVAEAATPSTAVSSGDLIDVPMPQMGESIAEGTLTRWFKKAGESIERDEPLFEISTDKVDAEVPAPANGVLAEILVAEGTTVEVNTVVARIGSGVGGTTAAPAAESAPAAPASLPPASPPPAPAAPVPPQPHVEVAAAAARPANSDPRAVRSSPLVRKIAREHRITDLSVIAGTGAGGRVTKNDILGFIARPAAAPPTSPVAAPAATSAAITRSAVPTTSDPSDRSGVTVEKMSVMRRKIAEHMIDSKRTSAHVHSVFEADMTQIVSIRASKKDQFLAANGTKLTYMPFFLKACSDALRIFPHVNASIDGDDILVHHSVNIGIAVALEHGLIVPVIKGVQDLSIPGIQKSVSDLANRARKKQLLPDEVAGGTFTITNPGQFGGLFGIPIINQPQVAILGIGGIEKRPVVVDGDKIAIRDMTYMCLSYDHRLVDGALADQFMAQVKKNLESFEAYSVV